MRSRPFNLGVHTHIMVKNQLSTQLQNQTETELVLPIQILTARLDQPVSDTLQAYLELCRPGPTCG